MDLIDLLLALPGMKQRRRRDIFGELLVPIHTVFGDIHKDYLALFEATKLACPTRSGNSEWRYNRDGRLHIVTRDADVAKPLAQAKKDFSQWRQRLEPDRIEVRAQVTTILNAPVDKEEKRYLWGMLSYLLYPDKAIGSSPQQIDAEISFVQLRGSIRAMNTPTSYLLERIDPITDPNEVFELVDDCEAHLKERWAEVTVLWSEAHLTVLRKTTPLKEK